MTAPSCLLVPATEEDQRKAAQASQCKCHGFRYRIQSHRIIIYDYRTEYILKHRRLWRLHSADRRNPEITSRASIKTISKIHLNLIPVSQIGRPANRHNVIECVRTQIRCKPAAHAGPTNRTDGDGIRCNSYRTTFISNGAPVRPQRIFLIGSIGRSGCQHDIIVRVWRKNGWGSSTTGICSDILGIIGRRIGLYARSCIG